MPSQIVVLDMECNVELDLGKVLPNFNRINEGNQFFCTLGAKYMDDLDLLKEQDLSSFFTLVEAQKIIHYTKMQG